MTRRAMERWHQLILRAKHQQAASSLLTFLIRLCSSCKELHYEAQCQFKLLLSIVRSDRPLPPTHLVALFQEALGCLYDVLDGVHSYLWCSERPKCDLRRVFVKSVAGKRRLLAAIHRPLASRDRLLSPTSVRMAASTSVSAMRLLSIQQTACEACTVSPTESSLFESSLTICRVRSSVFFLHIDAVGEAHCEGISHFSKASASHYRPFSKLAGLFSTSAADYKRDSFQQL